MTFKRANKSSEFELAPEGTHAAYLVQIIDLGFHEKTWEGVTTLKQQVRLGFELPEELMSDGRPYIVFKTVSKSLWASKLGPASALAEIVAKATKAKSKENLTDEDVQESLGKPLQVTVVHNQFRDSTFANITEVSTLNPKLAAGLPEPQNELLLFDTDTPDNTVLNKLSDSTKKKIAEGTAKGKSAGLVANENTPQF